MRSWLACFALIVAMAEPAQVQERRVELQLIDRARLPGEVLVTLRREAQQVWSDRLSIEWSALRANPPAEGPGDYLYVIVYERAAPSSRVGAIATIGFIGVEPTNLIRVYAAEARRLLDDDPELRYEAQPMKVRNAAMGRVLGRAVAHEIGHYVRRSPRHSATGLMKGSHSIASLSGAARSDFLVDSPSIAAEDVGDCSLSLMELGRN